jgi:serine-type D-Ala-D-Ala carboxypeptidase
VTCCLPPFDSEFFLASVDQLFARAVTEKTFSGASLLVGKPDLIQFHKTWGHTHHGGDEAVDAYTLFDLASLTKPLVAAPLCMRAVSEGKLALDGTLPLFFSSDLLASEKRVITIRQLLGHSSGLPAYEPFYRDLIFIEPSRRHDVLLQRILRTPLMSEPQTTSCYSDLGFMLLAMILEIVYGKPIDHLASQFLFEPLGLSFADSCSLSGHRTSAAEGNPASKPPSLGGRGWGRGPINACFHPHLTSPVKGEERGADFRPAALGFCPLQVPTDPTVPPERLTPISRAFVATEDCPWRNRLLAGEVHDENAYCLGGVAGHAGLFGSAHGVFDLLVFLWEVYRGRISDQFWTAEVVKDFWSKQSATTNTGWMLGYDTPNLQNSSAGNYFSPRSPGHLGFTGTSFWFDLNQEILVILLTNRVCPTRENDRLKSFRPLLHNLVMETYYGLSKR